MRTVVLLTLWAILYALLDSASTRENTTNRRLAVIAQIMALGDTVTDTLYYTTVVSTVRVVKHLWRSLPAGLGLAVRGRFVIVTVALRWIVPSTGSNEWTAFHCIWPFGGTCEHCDRVRIMGMNIRIWSSDICARHCARHRIRTRAGGTCRQLLRSSETERHHGHNQTKQRRNIVSWPKRGQWTSIQFTWPEIFTSGSTYTMKPRNRSSQF